MVKIKPKPDMHDAGCSIQLWDREAPLATGLLICDVEEKNEEVEQASLNSLASNNLTYAGKTITKLKVWNNFEFSLTRGWYLAARASDVDIECTL